MRTNKHTDHPSLSAIEARRRMQFIDTTIDTLAELGYMGTSFSQIAVRAGVSKGLASYHFKNKDDLMFQTIQHIMTGWHTYIRQQVEAQPTMRDAFTMYIKSNIEYMTARPTYFPAIVEIFFNARDSNGRLLYRIDEDDLNITILERILITGQSNGEFESSFAPRMAAISVRSSIDQVLGQMTAWPRFDVLSYTQEITALYLRAIDECT